MSQKWKILTVKKSDVQKKGFQFLFFFSRMMKIENSEENFF